MFLGDVVAAQNGLDFLERFGCKPLQVAHLAEGVLDEVFHRLIQCRPRRRSLELERLPGHEVFGGGEHFAEQGRQPFPPLAVVFGAVPQDAFGRFGQRAVVLAGQVLLGLEIRPQFPAQALVVAQADQDVATLGGTFEDRLALVVDFVVVGQGRDDRDEQGPVLLVADGELVAAAVEVEVHLVGAEAVLALPLQHVLEDDLALELGLLAAREIDLS